jgi:hypothetical protein
MFEKIGAPTILSNKKGFLATPCPPKKLKLVMSFETPMVIKESRITTTGVLNKSHE